MRVATARWLVRVEFSMAIGAGLAMPLLYVAQPSFMGGPIEPPMTGGPPFPVLAVGLYLIGFGWMLEIAREDT